MLTVTLYLYSFADGLSLLVGAAVCLTLVGLAKTWYHLVLIVIYIEILILLNFLLFRRVGVAGVSVGLLFLLASFIVSGARMGISILTQIVRIHGNDFTML